MLRFLILFALSLPAACAASQQGQKVHRQPMRKSDVVLKSPTEYAKRDLGRDPKTNEPASYDPKPKVELVDEKSGRYAFKWIGYDGKEKVVEYQRADAIDAVVSASVSRTPAGEYLYTYRVSNLPSSPTHLSSFIIQNFADDVKPVEVNGKPTNTADIHLLRAFRDAPTGGQPRNFESLHFGEMSNQIEVFREGNWLHLSIFSDFEPTVIPGQEIELKLLSSAPPALVGCRITGGSLTLKGAGEHMPTELEDAMPGYEEWPRGFTVGPVRRMADLSAGEKSKYLLGQLRQFEQLGWMTAQARQWYEESLGRSNDFESVLRRLDEDLKSEQITSEVYALFQSLK